MLTLKVLNDIFIQTHPVRLSGRPFCRQFFQKSFALPLSRDLRIDEIGMRINDVQMIRFNELSGQFEVGTRENS